MRPHPNCIPLSVLCLLTATAAQAQGVFELDEITAFANLTPKQVNRTGATVDVIQTEELRAAGTQRVSDFLARRAGISATSAGGPGSQTKLRIRGLDDKYIAVRVDGIDVTDPSAPQTAFNFGTLTTADISRIEIVKGSQSALYGTAAVGGVINITTNRATEPGTTIGVDLEVGSFDTVIGSFNLSTLTNRGGAAFTLSRIQTDGFSAADENNGNPEADGFEATRFSFSGDYSISETLRIGASGFWEQSESEFDNFQSVPPFLPADGPFLTEGDETETRGLRLFADMDSGAIDHEVALSWYDIDRANNFGSGTSDFSGDRRGIDYLGTTTILEGTTLSFGAAYLEEEFTTSDSFGGAATGGRTIGAVFAETLFAASPDLDLAVSARYDDYSDFGDFLSGRLALAWRPAQGTVVRAIVSNGFRAPSLFEINDPTYGNADLSPEESVTYELGMEHAFANGAFLQATLFYTEIEDLIDFAFPAGYIQTDGLTETRGIELTGSLPLGTGAELFGNYTYTDAQDPSGGQLRRVPVHDLTLGLEGDITDRVGGLLTAQYVADLNDGVPLDDYVVANATVTYAISDRAETYLRVENIFDEQYQVLSGYGTSDRAFYLGLRASF